MHTGMTAVKIQSNKIVLNEVKDNQALPEPSQGKNIMDFLANPIFLPCDPAVEFFNSYPYELKLIPLLKAIVNIYSSFMYVTK